MRIQIKGAHVHPSSALVQIKSSQRMKLTTGPEKNRPEVHHNRSGGVIEGDRSSVRMERKDQYRVRKTGGPDVRRQCRGLYPIKIRTDGSLVRGPSVDPVIIVASVEKRDSLHKQGQLSNILNGANLPKRANKEWFSSKLIRVD